MQSLLRLPGLSLLCGIVLFFNGPPASRGQGADMFANATTIGGVLVLPIFTDATNFTMENGEPGHSPGGGATRGISSWWKWTAPSNGFCTVDLTDVASSILLLMNSGIAVYTAPAVNPSVSNLTRIAAGGVETLAARGSITFAATQGVTYYFAVDSRVNSGNIKATYLLALRHYEPASGSAIGSFAGIEPLESAGQLGKISYQRTALNRITGMLQIGARKLAFKAPISAKGIATIVFSPTALVPGQPQAPLSLEIDVIPGINGKNTFRIFDGGEVATVGEALPGAPAAESIASPVAGRYTMTLGFPATTGNGFAIVKISKTGKLTLAGKSGDGVKLSAGSTLGIIGAVRTAAIHQSLLSGKGAFSGPLVIEQGGNIRNDLAVKLSYLRPVSTGTFYPGGILSANITASGQRYAAPTAGRALGFLNATSGAGKLVITAAAGEIGAVTENLTLSTANKFVFASPPRRPKLTLDPATGLVTGTIVEPAGLTRRLSGILYNDGAVRLRGLVSGSTRTAAFQVTM